MVGRSSGREETHWIAIERMTSRLSVCTPSQFGSTMSRCLFSETKKFNCNIEIDACVKIELSSIVRVVVLQS